MIAPPKNQNPALTAIRADRAAFERMRRGLLGELVEVLRANEGRYPRRVGAILDKIERVEKRISDANAAFARVLEESAAENRDEARARHRLNALVAVYVEGLELVADSGGTRWHQVDATTGKYRDVPNYAGDYGVARRALERFPAGELTAVATRLEQMTDRNPAVVGVLMAPPADLCAAMLAVLHVSPTAPVPTIAK